MGTFVNKVDKPTLKVKQGENITKCVRIFSAINSPAKREIVFQIP